MPLLPLYGHAPVRRRLEEAVTRGALPASLLLHGPRGIGKQQLALWLGARLLCTGANPRPCRSCQHCRYAREGRHPDLHWFFPRPRLKDGDPSAAEVRDDYREAIADRAKEGGCYPPPAANEAIYVATVRAVVATAAMSPAFGARKIFVMGDAERMVPQEGADAAANAFLKLLEEPPADTTLVLTSSEPGALLPTIRSRVVALRVSPLGVAELRDFLADPAVRAALAQSATPVDDEAGVRATGGAPGALFAGSHRSEAFVQARRLLDAASSGDRAAGLRTAFALGASRTRGGFENTLDALTVLLHGIAREGAARADVRRALGATRAVDAVERAKERACGNVSPQLLGASLVRELTAALG